jgi:hypothetical protein
MENKPEFSSMNETDVREIIVRPVVYLIIFRILITLFGALLQLAKIGKRKMMGSTEMTSSRHVLPRTVEFGAKLC